MEVECLALKDLTTPRKTLPVGEEGEDEGQSEQKENICLERRRSTPLKSSDSAVPSLLLNRRGATPDLAHITPIKHGGLAEPWTPTANLKMLISAASPDIRDREMKKVLFRPMENDKEQSQRPDAVVEDPEEDDTTQFDTMMDVEEDVEKKPSRKQKSLGLLCQKFLALYPDYPPLHTQIWISLDEVATSLGVERRRIYDIVNVLESLMIVGRIAKNSYTWYGRHRLEATLAELQRQGLQQGYHLQMELAAEAGEAVLGREDDGGDGDAGNAASNRKDKSLRIMSQKFVMLFLVSKTQTVTLDAAAKVLIEEGQDSSSHSKYKTKVRRLYDIANVLTSLGLIKKVHVREERGRKPAFKWIGPIEFSHAGNPMKVGAVALPGAAQPTKLARHSSFNIAPACSGVQRLVSSAPSTPGRDLTGLSHLPVDYSTKTQSNGAVCRLQFGNTAELRPSAPPPSLSSPHPSLLTPHLFTSSSSSSSHPCVAYMPSLSQPSVVMLYTAPEKPEPQDSSSVEGRKRRRDEEEDEAAAAVKKLISSDEDSSKGGVDPLRESPSSRPLDPLLSESPGRSSDAAPPSHYLYVPNNAGLNSLNFLLSAGHPPGGVSLPPGGVPAVALPYVLLPSAALSHFPLVPPSSDPNLGFSLSAMMSPAHFMLGASPYGLAADMVSSPSSSSPSTPEQRKGQGSQSPTGTQQHNSRTTTPLPLTPHTPKETSTPSCSSSSSSSSAFFQTPGTLGVSSAPRRRGSVQRRLDVGHPPTG